jgi:hypothetical protein
MTDKEIIQEFIDMCVSHDFDYTITTDLSKWKEGINKEYLIRKKLIDVIEHFGQDEVSTLEKIILKAVPDNMVHSIIPTTIKLWFLPHKRLNNKSSGVSQYQMSVGKTLKGR